MSPPLGIRSSNPISLQKKTKSSTKTRASIFGSKNSKSNGSSRKQRLSSIDIEFFDEDENSLLFEPKKEIKSRSNRGMSRLFITQKYFIGVRSGLLALKPI